MWLMQQNTENLIHKEEPKWQHVSLHRYEACNILNGLNQWSTTLIPELGMELELMRFYRNQLLPELYISGLNGS